MNKLKGIFLKIGGFGFAPLLISLASIASLPIILNRLGEGVWLSIATGQTAGELARLITIWGWNSVGLSVAAALGKKERIIYYLDSLPARFILFMISISFIGILSIVMPVESKIGFFLMASAGSVLGLAGSWVYIAARDPKKLIVFDSLPRTLGIIFGALALFIMPTVYTFSFFIIAGNSIAVILPLIHHIKLKKENNLLISKISFRKILKSIKSGFSAFLIGFIMSLRMSFPVLLAPTLIPESAGIVALADKFMRWGNTGMTPIMQYVQTGIPRYPGDLRQQIRKGTKITLTLSTVMAIIATLATIILSPYMSAGTIEVSPAIAATVGLVLGLVFMTTVTGNTSLVLLGKVGTVARGSVISLLVLVAIITPAASYWDALGIMAAYAISELGILAFQMFVLKKTVK